MPLGKNADRVLRLIQAEPDISVREIADILGLSTQRVYQIMHALADRGDLVIEESA